MARSASLRASDADRDTVAERLRRAAVEGRLEPDELEERLHLALRARTYGDLRRLVADLPGRPATWAEGRPSFAGTALAVAVRVAVVLVAVAAVVAVFAFTAMWWILWALVWMTMRGRHGGCRPATAWRPPRARRI